MEENAISQSVDWTLPLHQLGVPLKTMEERLATHLSIILRHVQPGFKPLTPAEVASHEWTLLHAAHSADAAQVVQLSASVVLKYGYRVCVEEADMMRYVKEHSSIPVPEVFACYRHGPIPGRRGDLSHKTYIFMQYIPGQTLKDVWPSLDEATRARVARSLRNYLTELRSLPGKSWVGSPDRGGVRVHFLGNGPQGVFIRRRRRYMKAPLIEARPGPFATVNDFHEALIDVYGRLTKSFSAVLLRRALSQREHRIVLTHGDFHPSNIIVHDGAVAAIIDWEYGGWFPEHWETMKALYRNDGRHDFFPYLLDILEEYYCEWGAFLQYFQIVL